MFKVLRQPFFEMDSGAMGGGDPAGQGSEPASSAPAPNPGWGLPNGGNQAAPAAGNPMLNPPPTVQEQAAGQVFDFAGRKIEVSDPNMMAALKDVHKDYSALQGTYTQTNQRMKELEQANQTYLNLLQTMQPQNGQPNANQTQQSQPQPEEDLEQIKADFMEKFYDNPLSAIEGLMDSMYQTKVQPIIEPITKEREWNEQVQALQNKYPDDFNSLIGPMQELIQEMPQLTQHGLEAVYNLAKRTQPAPQQAAPTPEQLMNDPKFLQQMLQKPEIQKQFLSQYLQEKQGSQQQAPTIMGGQPGGQMPSTPENRPTDIRGATKAFKRHLGLGG